MAATFRIGADLGFSNDFTAICCIRESGDQYRAIDISRVPLRTEYPMIRRKIVETAEAFTRWIDRNEPRPSRSPYTGEYLKPTISILVDTTGARSFGQELAEDLATFDNVVLRQVQLTAGTKSSEHDRTLNISMAALFERLTALIQSRRITSGHPDFRLAQDELKRLQVTRSQTGGLSFGASTGHDDLAVALALAAWLPSSREDETDLIAMNRRLRGGRIAGGGDLAGWGDGDLHTGGGNIFRQSW